MHIQGDEMKRRTRNTQSFAIALLSMAMMAPASAHVSLQPKEASAGASYKAVFAVPHGCDGKSTTSIRVQIPEGVIAVKPMPKPGWALETVRGPYSRTFKYFHGAELSEGVKEVVWSGGQLSDDHFDEFVLRAFVASDLAATPHIYWPVIQMCGDTELKWNEIPSAGQNEHALKHPASALRLVASKASQQSAATSYQLKNLVIDNPWTRATPGGATVAGGYVKITNKGDRPDRLIGGTFAPAATVEVHEVAESDGIMKMRRLDKGLEIPPGSTTELKPGGYHLMFMGLKQPLKDGQSVKGTLKFESAGEVPVEFQIAPLGAPSATPSTGQHGAHGHH